jgi:drug/metabolite transporter (DMT)-like permease
MIWLLAGADAAAGLYLVLYAYGRERRDKPGVLIVGVVLLLCAAMLAGLGLRLAQGRGDRVQLGEVTSPAQLAAGASG